MTVRQRKLVGILVLLAVLIGYSALAVALHQTLFATLPMPVQLIYFAVAGIGWALPAGAVIKWMQRPDAA